MLSLRFWLFLVYKDYSFKYCFILPMYVKLFLL